MAMTKKERAALADMANATAWINHLTAQANYDLHNFGNWRCDYSMKAAEIQAEYEKAKKVLFDGDSQIVEAEAEEGTNDGGI